MKSLLFSFILLFFLSVRLSAQCQLCYLNKEQSLKVVALLEIKEDLVIFSACENNDIARRVKIDSVFAKTADRQGYYEIQIQGTIVATFDIVNQMPDNYVKVEVKFDETVDLAYLHIKTGRYFDEHTGKTISDATCLGIYLGYDCDPCIDPFDYPVQPF